MMVPVALLLLGALIAAVGPRLLARADWPERAPVVALWAWQCVVGGVLVCCALSMALSASAAWQTVREGVFAPAPRPVVEAYVLGAPRPWAAATAVLLACGGLWTAVMLLREMVTAGRRLRRQRTELLLRAPLLPGEESHGERVVVLEGARPAAWWLPGSTPRLVITTVALQRLRGRQLDAVLAHEQGHARARHEWLLRCADALASGFPRLPVFAAFRAEMHRLVELAADDMAARRCGRLTTALALVGLNDDRGVFGPYAAPQAYLPQRVQRLLAPPARLTAARRLRLTVCASLVPLVPLLVTFLPGLRALG